MKILIAEDEPSILMQYSLVLNERGHKVVLTDNGVSCLDEYHSALRNSSSLNRRLDGHGLVPPFDLVVLDYRMPRKDGLEVAVEILDACPAQRLMFASAYTAQTLIDAVRRLHKVVELLQKPFDLEYFVDAVEDKALYEQLERLNVRVRMLKDHSLTHSQLVSLLEGVHKLQKLIT